jgi:N-acetylglucosaminyldiphosphoundecaprenol N-acetyl-beta-D-mannosaminyltransferase
MNPPPVPRYNVLGVGVSALTFLQARDLIVGARGAGSPGYVCLCTVNGLGEARADPALRRIFNESWLTTADGMPVVWMGPPGVERVYGPDLMLAVCDAGRASGLRHYFYGGGPGVAADLVARLSARFPGLAVAGAFTPPFRDLDDAEMDRLRAELGGARPDIMWVGLGTPKQERFMAGPGMTLGPALMVGVGAAFDFHSGRVRQAPRWVQRSGLEWLFRLCAEPRRLGPRYLRTNSMFVLRLAAQWLRIRDYPLGQSE